MKPPSDLKYACSYHSRKIRGVIWQSGHECVFSNQKGLDSNPSPVAHFLCKLQATQPLRTSSHFPEHSTYWLKISALECHGCSFNSVLHLTCGVNLGTTLAQSFTKESSSISTPPQTIHKVKRLHQISMEDGYTLSVLGLLHFR